MTIQARVEKAIERGKANFELVEYYERYALGFFQAANACVTKKLKVFEQLLFGAEICFS